MRLTLRTMTQAPLLPLQQSARYAAALRLMGRAVTEIETEGPPVLMIRRRLGPLPLAYLPRADFSGGRAAVLSALPRGTVRLVIPETGGHPGLAGFPILTPQHVAEIELPARPVHDQLMARMHGKWRNRLRRALEGPLTVRQSHLDPAAHDPLLAHERAQRRIRGYRSYPAAFLEAYAAANPHHSCLLEARREGETLAYMLFLLHGPVATYTIGWTGPEGRRLHAHTLLLWTAMCSLFAKGITRLDLGTVDTEGGADLARFKIGAGARVRQLGPTLLVPPGFRVSP